MKGKHHCQWRHNCFIYSQFSPVRFDLSILANVQQLFWIYLKKKEIIIKKKKNSRLGCLQEFSHLEDLALHTRNKAMMLADTPIFQLALSMAIKKNYSNMEIINSAMNKSRGEHNGEEYIMSEWGNVKGSWEICLIATLNLIWSRLNRRLQSSVNGAWVMKRRVKTKAAWNAHSRQRSKQRGNWRFAYRLWWSIAIDWSLL